MTLKTVTYDTTTHKVVPLELDENMYAAYVGRTPLAGIQYMRESCKQEWDTLTRAAPEFKGLPAHFVLPVGYAYRFSDSFGGQIAGIFPARNLPPEILNTMEFGVKTPVYLHPPASKETK